MKKYWIFLFVLFLVSMQGQASNSCIISRFYDETGTITQAVYNKPFNIDVVIHYDPTIIADKLLVNIQLPANNFKYISQIVPNVTTPVIRGDYTTNSNVLTVPLTGFSTTDFTLHILNVYMSPNEVCNPTAFVYSTFMQSSSEGIINNSATTAVNSLSISGIHNLGIIQLFSLAPFSYDNTTNEKSPLYYDLGINVYQGTYLSENIYVSLNSNSNLAIKKVVLLNNTTLTAGTDGRYQIPILNSPSESYVSYQQRFNIRVYFDINSSGTQPFKLNLNVAANFNIPCTISTNNFTEILSSPNTLNVKNDDLILQYPSIYDNYNYTVPDALYIKCQEEVNLNFNLDNIYNQNVSNVVTTLDSLKNITIKKIIFDPDMLPVVSVKYTNSNSYQTVNYDANDPYIITFTNTAVIESIKMQYAQVLSKISTIRINASISSGIGSVTYNLLKSDLPYAYFTKKMTSVSPPSNQSYVSGANLLGIGDVVTNVIQYQFYQTLSANDYIEYQLNPNMTFAGDLQLLFSLNGSTWSTKENFNVNNPPLSSDPNPMNYEIIGQKIRITHVPVSGYYNTCNNSVPYILYVKLNTKVVDRPTALSNTNYSFFVANNGTTATPYGYGAYAWKIDVTQNILPIINLSCDETTFSNDLTVKSGDSFSIQYTLQNIVPIKYDFSSPVFYINLLKSGVMPTISLVQVNGIDFTTHTLPTSAYNLYYATANDADNTMELGYLNTLTYLPSKNSNSNIVKITFNSVIVDYYDKLILTATYSPGLVLSDTTFVNFSLSLGAFTPNLFKKNRLKVGPKSDCDLFDCQECITSFSPTAGEEYIISAWVKESYTANPPTTYTNSGIRITFNDGAINTFPLFRPSGPIVDGWQRIEVSFIVPTGAKNIHIALVNESANTDVFFDDIRIHPYNSNMKSFVYNPSTQKLVAELDENNFATLYEYDDEGILIRVKKETERGIMTIKETRSNQSKIRQ